MNPDGPLYEQIARHVAGLVEAGVLPTGGRIPSVRKLSRQFEVSTNTVLQGLSVLEARDVLEARPRSGFYVRRSAAAEMALPRTEARPVGSVRVALGDRVPGLFRAMRQVSMVPLGAAGLSPALLPFAKLSAAAARVARASGPLAINYDPLPGYPPLRREIARRLVAAGCAVSPDDVLTTVGAIEALHLALRAVTSPGDTVLVESPCYFGVLQLLSALNLRAAEIPCDADRGIRVSLVERALRRRRFSACVVVPNFSNPLGSLMPVEEKRALVKLCRQHAVPLIESDVYGELPFEGERPVPLKAFDRGGWVMHCSSFSKALAPSFRVGWICAGRFQARVEELKFAHTVATPTLPQAAIAEYLVSGSYDRHLRGLRRALREQTHQLRDAIARHFPPGTRLSAPAGGFLLWAELPDLSMDALELQRRALKLGISIAPGPIFSAGDGHRHCLRINGGYPWSETIERAIQTLGRLAGAKRPPAAASTAGSRVGDARG